MAHFSGPSPSLRGLLLIFTAMLPAILLASPTRTDLEKAASPRPKRIVSLAPSLTETIEALGASEALVAITRFCRIPKSAPALRQIERMDSPNLETILSLKPDLVVATPLTQRNALDQMRALRLPLLVLEQQSLEAIPEEIRQLGQALHQPAAAEALNARLRKQLETIETQSLPLPQLRTLLLYDWKALYSANGKTFAGQLLRRAGAHNLAEKHESPWPRLSAEWILSARPECILLSRPGDAPDPAPEALALWKKDPLWKQIPAVQNGRIHSIPDDLLSIPGPRLGEAAEAIWQRLHSPQAPPASASQSPPP